MTFKKRLFYMSLVLSLLVYLFPGWTIGQGTAGKNGDDGNNGINGFNGAKKEERPQEPRIHIDPPRLDFGLVPAGQRATKRIEITNPGRGILKWHGYVPRESSYGNRMGHYIGLANDEIKSSGTYRVPGIYREIMEVSGRWSESDGYPVFDAGSVMKYHFTGTGLRVYFWKEPDGGKYSVYIEQNFVAEIDAQGHKKERSDLLVADRLPMGQHTLTIVGKEGKATLEGFQVFGNKDVRGPRGWISLLPAIGDTTREIDYVAIVVNTLKMNPGVYSDFVNFSSNGGNISIPISVEIPNEISHKVIDVYRYSSGKDYLFTSHPQADWNLISSRGYVKEGIAFRLFPYGTPGTLEFMRWFNPATGRHYYTHNRYEAQKLDRAYVYEGPIGNIATMRLRGTRELYRWVNPSSGSYFYSMDSRGDGIQRKGYRFDGIAGYVR
ncbi:MAG: hypothetical protein CSYNP_03727 [Syntrophus sp. SKADARSKE-3]|nr:hypothetical protein [Syntrophus sp. SKADARSKE-3]